MISGISGGSLTSNINVLSGLSQTVSNLTRASSSGASSASSSSSSYPYSEAMDTNNDGVVSQAEYLAYMRKIQEEAASKLEQKSDNTKAINDTGQNSNDDKAVSDTEQSSGSAKVESSEYSYAVQQYLNSVATTETTYNLINCQV
ncbi:MAG: hypothetical protein A4E52_01730 [Pelotomaculum sp. PtaB.Bin013]|uniref:EF-hand domain-containing protein n=1 Tax=Pelotomaculum isophthalicicum JI TaxID=947010 RepID=A0A9X4JWB0_9FIRM|nr:hypothetical protein [Pelotomaculum isophthalicicum]MDF9409806.1 hypothetical protein [Pelotomaculum isophthalicicum JI]OPX84543.1 MAG: hypothetical protein A4E52_01730 [Pelotomaculum sp. PtaB.Bin013]